MLPSFLEVVFPSMKGWFLCAVPHFMRLVVPGSHGLFFGVFPGSHGSHGGMSRFIQDSRGPLSLYSLGTEEAGTASSLIRRSCFADDFDLFGVVSLDRGTSSLFFFGLFSGYFIGEILSLSP